MSKMAEERIKKMRDTLSKAGAEEMTPVEGIQLRADWRGGYFIEEMRYLIAYVERHFFMWDLCPQGVQQ